MSRKSKSAPDLGRKVGDEPREMLVTPSGADPTTLEQLNPPAAVDDEHADDDGESAPLVKRITNHDTLVEAQHQGADTGSAMAKEGVFGSDEDYRAAVEARNDTTTGPDADKETGIGEPYDIFARSGAQQPGGGAHSMSEPSNKKNADINGAEKIHAMISHMPKDTPGDHTVYGYAGYKVTIDDLRAIAEGFGGEDDGKLPKSEEAQDNDE